MPTSRELGIASYLQPPWAGFFTGAVKGVERNPKSDDWRGEHLGFYSEENLACPQTSPHGDPWRQSPPATGKEQRPDRPGVGAFPSRASAPLPGNEAGHNHLDVTTASPSKIDLSARRQYWDRADAAFHTRGGRGREVQYRRSPAGRR